MQEQTKHIAVQLLDKLSDLIGYKVIKKQQNGTNNLNSKWFNGLFLSFDSLKTIDRCYEFVAENKPYFALVQIMEDFNSFLGMVNSFDIEDLQNHNCAQLKIRLVLIDIINEYNKWVETEYTPIIESYKGTHLFKDEEFEVKENFSPSLFCYIEETIKEDLFKSYVYKNGSGRINQNTQFYVYPKIGISHSLEEWLTFVDQQDMSVAGDKAIVTLFYKQDYASSHFNYFIITIHHKDSIWLSTDQIFFHNPRNKTSRRKPERSRKSHYANVALPYGLDESIPELRKAATSLVRVGDEAITYMPIVEEEWTEFIECEYKKLQVEDGNKHWRKSFDIFAPIIAKKILSDKNIQFSVTDNNGDFTYFRHEGKNVALLKIEDREWELLIYNYPEILQKSFFELDTIEKVYFLGLVSRIFEEIGYEPPTNKITTGYRHLNQILLTAPEFRYDDNVALENEEGNYNGEDLYEANKYRFGGFNYDNKLVFDEIMESLELPTTQSKELIVSEVKDVIHSKSYEKDWLGVPEALNNNIKWSILEDKAIKLKKEIKNIVTKERIKEDTVLLNSMLTDMVETIYGIAFNNIKSPDLDVYGTFNNKPLGSKNRRNRIDEDDYSFDIGYKEQIIDWVTLVDKPLTNAEQVNKHTRGYFKLLLPEYVWNPHQKHEPKCKLCANDVKIKHWRIKVDIHHYRQLMVILGIDDRMELPLAYRNYRAHSCIPYKGNSILDNTHPYTLIKDPVSDMHPNGFTITVWMCANCFKKLKEKYTTK